MIIEKENKIINIRNNYLYIGITLIISLFIVYISVVFEDKLYNIINIISFLTWHTLFEFTSIIISFIIFINCYHSYIHLKRIRLLILSITFFLTGTIDFLHTISYEGMPYTFVESSAVMATTYWMVGRLFMSLGLLITSIIPFEKKSDIKGRYVLLPVILLNLVIFYIITYKVYLIPPFYVEGVGITKFKIVMECLVMVLQCLAIIFYLKTYNRVENKYIIILCCGLIFSIFSEALFTLYKSVYDTYNLLGHIYKITAFYLIYHSIFKYNVDNPYTELEKAQNRVKLYANNLEKIVDKRTKEIKKANKKLTEELDYAKYVQQSLLPKGEIMFENISFVSQYIPCERLSGDFFGIYEIDSDNIGMYILDVSGHGVPSALLTILSNNYLKAEEKNIYDLSPVQPHERLEYFYQEYNKLSFPDEMYIVVFFAVYNKHTKKLSYSSGGINCFPIVVKKNGEYELLNKSGGFPICKFIDDYTPEYKSVEVQLEQGDKVIFFTDGLIEKHKNGILDEKGVIDILVKCSHKDNKAINNEILDKLQEFKNIIDDDITYFIMEIK